MIRPDGGSAATNASRSGGRYLSVTVRCIRCGRCIHRTGCETAPDDFFRPGPSLIFRRTRLVVALVLAFALAVFVASPFRDVADGAIVGAHDRSIVVVTIVL
jgi:hypothetical protein